MLRGIVRWFGQIGEDGPLAKAQAVQLYRQVPLLYGLLLINSIAIAYTHSTEAPLGLTLSLPIVLFGATAARLVYWLRVKPNPTFETARRHLRTITILAALMGMAYVAWSVSLMRYGGPFEQAHIALYISTTVIGCIFCLVHLPQAAVIVAVCVLPPFLVNTVQQRFEFAPIAINVILVLMVLLRVLFNSFESFRNSVAARAELAIQHTELMRLNEENRLIAMTDSLTQLANRRSFYDDLSAIAEDPSARGSMAVGLIDLDRFKPVNDTFGHHFGDQLLAEIARRLAHTAGPFAKLYRLGGDEFGTIVHLDPDRSRELAERLCQAVSAPVTLADRQVTVGASIGLAPLFEQGVEIGDLAERADYALYHAKRNRPGTVVVFSRDLEREIRGDQAIEVELQSSPLEGELDVHVQPIVEAHSGRLIGGEVLVRWNSPRLGGVEPQRFIAIAERSNLIHRITMTVVDKALHVMKAVPSSVSISVNVSACDINAPEVVDEIIARVRASGVDPSRLWIEVTETAVMRDMGAAIEALSAFRKAGIKVALDDFGTGYSSLSNLHRLPLDRVKIDRSFASDLENPYSMSIAMAVVGLCKTLRLSCLAEGVETAQQAALLRTMGCDLLQGYLFGRPQATGAFVGFVHKAAEAGLCPIDLAVA